MLIPHSGATQAHFKLNNLPQRDGHEFHRVTSCSAFCARESRLSALYRGGNQSCIHRPIGDDTIESEMNFYDLSFGRYHSGLFFFLHSAAAQVLRFLISWKAGVSHIQMGAIITGEYNGCGAYTHTCMHGTVKICINNADTARRCVYSYILAGINSTRHLCWTEFSWPFIQWNAAQPRVSYLRSINNNPAAYGLLRELPRLKRIIFFLLSNCRYPSYLLASPKAKLLLGCRHICEMQQNKVIRRTGKGREM